MSALVVMDNERNAKPDHVKEHIWRQHLAWKDVVTKEAEENFRKHQKRVEKSASSRDQQ
jgi:hypothetical protein